MTTTTAATAIHPAKVRPSHLGALVLAGALALAAAVMPGSALAQGDAITVSTASDDLGTYLVGPEGKTLYYFTRDVTPGQSVCSGGCLEAWPPLLVAEGQTLVAGDGVTGTLSSAPREDGSMQATYRGRPLYHWAADTEPGQTTGQGVNGVWFVALEDGTMPANPPALTLETASSDLGTFLTGRDGLTLYVFAADATPGVSTCAGDCLAAWPPVTVPPGNSVAAGEGVSGVLGLIPAADGSTQVTYDGHPLYYWQGDTEAGQTTGHGVNDVWWVADVSGNLPS
jgi:predicted lipoprotein with Yx(FWY)xxD motif